MFSSESSAPCCPATRGKWTRPRCWKRSSGSCRNTMVTVALLSPSARLVPLQGVMTSAGRSPGEGSCHSQHSPAPGTGFPDQQVRRGLASRLHRQPGERSQCSLTVAPSPGGGLHRGASSLEVPGAGRFCPKVRREKLPSSCPARSTSAFPGGTSVAPSSARGQFASWDPPHLESRARHVALRGLFSGSPSIPLAHAH